MVGRLVLVQVIGVRVPVPEPNERSEFGENLMTLSIAEGSLSHSTRFTRSWSTTNSNNQSLSSVF